MDAGGCSHERGRTGSRRVARLHDRLAAHVERGTVPGLAALVARGDDVHVEVLGTPAVDDPAPLRRDAIFRIASLTKPIAAAGAMLLVDDGVLSVAEPVETYLPELADRRVLRSLEGPLDDTVAAERSITVEDLLTFRLGFGAIMAPPDSYPIMRAEAELELMTLGPPWPVRPLTSDEWIARFATLPLLHQPGREWRYNTGAQVLGVLLERATGQPLEAFLRVAPVRAPRHGGHQLQRRGRRRRPRLTTAYEPDEATGGLRLLDPPVGGWWSAPPAMANASGMLVSTLPDLWAFVTMLEADGMHEGEQLLSSASVAAMTRDHLTAEQRESAELFLGAHGGWGYCMAAPGPVTAEPPVPCGYGWDGGTGTTWRTDPAGAHRHPAHATGHDVARTPSALHGLLACGVRRHGALRWPVGGPRRPGLGFAAHVFSSGGCRASAAPGAEKDKGAHMYTVIAVGTDGSDTADKAVEAAAGLARALGAALHIVTSYRPQSLGMAQVSGAALVDTGAEHAVARRSPPGAWARRRSRIGARD